MRKRCIRRHWAHMDPIALAIAGATVASQVDMEKLRLRDLTAIDNFSTGRATLNDFRDVCDIVNLAETMAGMGIGPEVLPVCQAVEQTLLVLKDEFEVRGCMPIWPDETRTLRDLYEYHDLQRSSIDRSTYERAIAKTRNRIRSAHPGVKVLA